MPGKIDQSELTLSLMHHTVSEAPDFIRLADEFPGR